MLFPEQTALELALFSSAGVLLKFSDELGERGRNVLGSAPAAGAAFAFWLLGSLNPGHSAVVWAVVLGNLAALKVDKPNLWAGLVVLVALSALFGLKFPHLPVLLLLSALAFLDEVVHGVSTGRFTRLLRARPALKIGVLALGALQLLPLDSAVGLLLFDFSYDAASALLGARRAEKTELSVWEG